MSIKKLAIIGGTGLNAFEEVSGAEESWQSTPYGEPSAPVETVRIAEKEVLFLARHGRPHMVPPHKINYRANVYALKEMGVDAVIAVNAVGAIAPNLVTPQIVVPHQIIDYTHSREHTFSDGSGLVELNHVDFSNPYDEDLRTSLIQCARKTDHILSASGIYACTQGPRLETSAEIEALTIVGCDIVGMTAMPEAGLARELDLSYVNLCLVVNPAAGLASSPIGMSDIKKAHEKGMIGIREVLNRFISQHVQV